MIVPSLIMMADWDKSVNKVMVVDDSGIVAPALESGAGDRVHHPRIA